MKATSVSKQFSCRVSSDCDCVQILQSMAEVFAARAGLDDIEANRVVLAVDELFANIVRHGYAEMAGAVDVEAAIISSDSDMELRFSFRDYAEPVAKLEDLKGRDLDKVCPGGLGLHLIRMVMDEVTHEVLPDGNRWMLIRRVALQE